MKHWLLPAGVLLGGLSTTLVDALSADPDYTILIGLLQRARLIPTLNRLTEGCTFFAPVNSAWTNDPFWGPLVLNEAEFSDNINEQLRQQLFYHLVNYTLPTNPPPEQNPINGTLGHDSQRLRLAFSNDSARVGVDALGNGGIEIIKAAPDAGNSTLFGIEGVLEPPPDLATVISRQTSISYFNRIASPQIQDFLNSSSALTVFLPTDDAWNVLHRIERLYLESDFADAELQRILNLHAVGKKGVAWSDTWYPAKNLTTLHGSKLEVVVSPEKTLVGQSTLVANDIYAANGVLHLVDSLLVPDNSLKLTPEKYLLALNCTSFVSLLHSVNLTSLVNETSTKITILAPSDEILAMYGDHFGDDDDSDLPPPGSQELDSLLRYHFIPGRWKPEDLKDGKLLQTALVEDGLDGKRQVLHVQVKNSDEKSTIKFGGASVVGSPIDVANTVIYLVSKPVTPPPDALAAVLPHLHLSSFLAAVFSTSLAETLKNAPRTTLLVPDNRAFADRLGGLVTKHFLSPTGKSDLEKVILHHVLDGVHYTDSFKPGSKQSFATLEGSDVTLSASTERGNTSFSISPSGGWPGLTAKLGPTNLLSQTGVIHEVSDLLLPRSVDVTFSKLLRAANGGTMIRLINAAGYGWILNGTAPPQDSEWAKDKMKHVAWVILCPDDDAFSDAPLEELLDEEHRDQLREFVEQHLIPSPLTASAADDEENSELEVNRPLVFDGSPTYSTARSLDSSYGDLVIDKAQGREGYIVGIKGARGTDGDKDWANIDSWGRTAISVSSLAAGHGGGVIKLDRVLYPYYPPWWLAVGVPVLVGVIGVFVISSLAYGAHKFMTREPEATYEPLGGFGADDD
ncbi:FAS1 domain-containing protein [Flagelloscypha sp. PMI_526]|nr:FAS1 domain-containing protein [Flagelloscypha sp. PMI_526]